MPSPGALSTEISSSEVMILLRLHERWRTEEVEDGRGATWKSGEGVFSGGVFPGARPLCFQEVDAGMKDRRENTLFFGLSTE